MAKKIISIACAVLVVGYGVNFAQRITESLDGWTLGTSPPEISSGTRGDGSSGGYTHLLVGTSPMYYEVMMEGEGSVDFWIYDPGNCLEELDPGYGQFGPAWGLQSPLYQSASIGINRKSYAAGCQGYHPWSTVAPYSPWWWVDGARGSHNTPFTPGWYRWSANGSWDNITFTQYDIDYDEIPGPGGYNLIHGDFSETYDATSFGGSWAALFGEGWKALWVRGDGASGIEDINVDVTGGSGVFTDLGASPVAKPYIEASWGQIKQLYR